MKKKLNLSLLLGAIISSYSYADIADDVFDESYFSELDYGLYWFGANNQFEKAGTDTINGSDYYDPAKPTFLYVHGWQSDSVTDLDRETFYDDENGRPEVDFADMWRNQGYNIGILYWNQFADEDEVKDAEAKIWSTNGAKGMRWLDSEGDYHSGDVDKPVAELLLENYSSVMSGYTGNDIRIAGHSLGSQVAIRLIRLLQESASDGDIADNLVPDRLTLLDAYFSNWGKSYLYWEWTGEAARTLVDEMIDEYDTAIDSYRTSATTSTLFVGDENTELHNKTAFSEQDTSFFSTTEQTQKHIAATWLYFWSIDYDAPDVESSSSLGVSAAADNDLVREWMSNVNVHIDQVEGGSTKDVDDNSYTMIPRL